MGRAPRLTPAEVAARIAGARDRLALQGLSSSAGLEGAGALRALSLRGNLALTEIEALRGLPLRELDLGGCALEDASPLESLAGLQRLGLARCPLVDMAALKAHFLSGGPEERAALMAWSGGLNFRWESAAGPGSGSEEDPLEALGEEDLHPEDPPAPEVFRRLMDSAHREALPEPRGLDRLPVGLRALDLSETGTRDLSFAARLRALEHLDLSGTRVVDLGPLPPLRSLDLCGTVAGGPWRVSEGLRLGPLTLEGAQDFPAIPALALLNCALRGGVLASLSKAPLVQLTLHGSTLEEAGLESLVGHPTLRELDLTRCWISLADQRALPRLGCRVITNKLKLEAPPDA